MAPSRKKAILRYLVADGRPTGREWSAGYLAPEELFAPADSSAFLLDLAGNTLPLRLSTVKWICFVRDFNSGDVTHPERLLQKTFSGRPRQAGLWLRLRLADGDSLEGLAANDLSLLDPAGVFLTPPDTRSNTQRVFIPRSAIAELAVVAVVGSAKEQPRRKPPASETAQDELFQGELLRNPEATG